MIYIEIFFFRVVVVRLDGILDFLEIEIFYNFIIFIFISFNVFYIKGKFVIFVN